MGLARLVFTLALCLLGLVQGIPSQYGGGGGGGGGGNAIFGGSNSIFSALSPSRPHSGGQPQNVFINAVSGPPLPDCAPQVNQVTQIKTVQRTRDVFTTQTVPQIVTRTAFSTQVITQTSNAVETVTTTVQIRSNIQEVETSTRVAVAYTVVPTTVTETTTRTQFQIQYATETSVLTRQVYEAQEEIVPVFVTHTAYGVNPVPQVRTDTVTVDSAIPVTVTFTEQVEVPVLLTETQTLRVPAVTSTIVNYVTQVVQATQNVPAEQVITHRDIHTIFVTEYVQGPATVVQTVFHTACDVGGSAALGVPLSGAIAAALPERSYTVVPAGPVGGAGVLGGPGGIALPSTDYGTPQTGGAAALGGPGGFAIPSTGYDTPLGAPLASTPALNYGTPN